MDDDDELTTTRYLVTNKGKPVGLYETEAIARAVSREINSTVYELGNIEDSQTNLSFITRFQDRIQYRTEN